MERDYLGNLMLLAFRRSEKIPFFCDGTCGGIGVTSSQGGFTCGGGFYCI